jgi:hypothetical protein
MKWMDGKKKIETSKKSEERGLKQEIDGWKKKIQRPPKI